MISVRPVFTLILGPQIAEVPLPNDLGLSGCLSTYLSLGSLPEIRRFGDG